MDVQLSKQSNVYLASTEEYLFRGNIMAYVCTEKKFISENQIAKASPFNKS